MDLNEKLSQAVIEGDSELAISLANQVIQRGMNISNAILNGLNAGMRVVSELYAKREYYLPEIIIAADALYAALQVLIPHIKKSIKHKGTVVIGVVRGDIHDIGKNLTKTFLEVSGYKLVDCGRNVKHETFIHALEEHQADVLALSTLMSPTLESIEELVVMVNKMDLRQKLTIIIGGAATSEQFARNLGVIYCPDASKAAAVLDEILSEVNK